jgi:hypothetical protein
MILVGEWELQLRTNSDLVRHYSRQIKRNGGTYEAARGKKYRSVFIRNNGNHSDRALANELIQKFGFPITTIVFRKTSSHLPAEVIFQSVPNNCVDPMAAAIGAFAEDCDKL